MHDLVRVNLGIIKRECSTCKYDHNGAETERASGSKTRCWHPVWVSGVDGQCDEDNSHPDWVAKDA